MVLVAQWLELSAVARVVAGSNPVEHPKITERVQIPYSSPNKPFKLSTNCKY